MPQRAKVQMCTTAAQKMVDDKKIEAHKVSSDAKIRTHRKAEEAKKK
jgi:hypothetical protein